MKKIISIVGTRPNFIKLSPLINNIPKRYSHVIINTGQHYDTNLSDIFFKELRIPRPKYNLETGSRKSHKQISHIFEKLIPILKKEKPHLILIYGDTNSSLAGALAASYINIPIAHIEAGIRCFDTSVPEEINRIVIDKLSTLAFCPTKLAAKNLRDEQSKSKVYFTGDIMFDLFKKTKPIKPKYKKLAREYLLATIHRQENSDPIKIKEIFKFLGIQGKQIIMPLHPRVTKLLKKIGNLPKNIQIIEPVAHNQLLYLIKNAQAVITDSGGIQKESYWLRIPCFTVRKSTEWPETLSFNKLQKTLSGKVEITKTKKVYNDQLFGEGNASKIMSRLIDHFLIAE